ncbi:MULTISPECIES: DUF3618 domain-containing protein [Halomonadaceae]|uniref:DUF3618 domain-containing protein n=1 Tax=Halomonadaceae TaxID=28256 RepID=UPI0015998D0D|nr:MULTISPECIES: DUF3618 domain-containing protein [Halomonas]QJQ96315.1 DUF3618 domain-containing protein [Halomonas sp. PA5]
MSDNNGRRSPDEIETEIHETRAKLDNTLTELENRLSPAKIMDSAYHHFRNGGANEFFASLGKTIKENPVPFLVTGIGLGWLALSHCQSEVRQNKGDGIVGTSITR